VAVVVVAVFQNGRLDVVPVHKSQNSSLMGYRSIASCPKYLKRLCLPLRPQNNGCKAKNWIACAIGLSSPTDLHWHRSQSVYPPSAYAIYQQRKIHFPADGFRFSHSSSSEKPVITLFTKDDCHLCDVAKEKVDKYRSMCHIEHVYIDREENSMWFQKYRYDIPVLHLNGKFLMKYKVLSGALEQAIENAVAGSRNERRAEKLDIANCKSRGGGSGISELLTFYSGNFLSRCAHLRKNKEILEEKMKQKTSKYVIFKGLQPLLIKKQRAAKELRTLSFTEVSHIVDSTDDILGTAIYLGNDSEDVDWFALNFWKDVDESLVKEVTKDESEFVNAFLGMMKLNERESSIAAQARGILAWHNSHQFCPECGSSSLMVEGGYRRQCTNDNCKTRQASSHHACYPRVDPVTMALILSPDHSKILLGRKPMFPPGLFTCLAGYVEPGESFEAAVHREMLEECGLPVSNVRYMLSQCWPFPSAIMFGCMATAEHMNVKMDDDELEELVWFDKDEAAGLISREAGKAFMAGERVQIAPGKHTLAHHLIKRWLGGYY